MLIRKSARVRRKTFFYGFDVDCPNVPSTKPKPRVGPQQEKATFRLSETKYHLSTSKYAKENLQLRKRLWRESVAASSNTSMGSLTLRSSNDEEAYYSADQSLFEAINCNSRTRLKRLYEEHQKQFIPVPVDVTSDDDCEAPTTAAARKKLIVEERRSARYCCWLTQKRNYVPVKRSPEMKRATSKGISVEAAYKIAQRMVKPRRQKKPSVPDGWLEYDAEGSLDSSDFGDDERDDEEEEEA